MVRHHGFYPARRRRGIALVVTLLVVMLLTFFISEVTFTTGLNLRSLQTYKETFQARSLARSVFSAVQIGLLMDEHIFWNGIGGAPGYRALQTILEFSPLPWEDQGLLIKLDVQPLDPLFDLNRFFNQVPGKDNDLIYWNLFQNLMADVIPVTEEIDLLPSPVEPETLAELYAALFDWVDEYDEVYEGWSGSTGAETIDYFGEDPEYNIKNSSLDRLSEIRLVRGLSESGIRWEEWESQFTVYERLNPVNRYPGLINPNVATRDEIVAFLEAHYMDDTMIDLLTDATLYDDIQPALNDYSDNAQTIAENLIPEDIPPKHTMALIKNALKLSGVNDNYAGQVFTSAYQYYRIKVVTEVSNVQARLEAVVFAKRDPTKRTAKKIKVLELILD